MDLLEFLQKEGPGVITPELLHPEEIADVRKMRCLRPFLDELVRGGQARTNLALLRQRQIGIASRRLERFVGRTGMRIVAHVDPLLFHKIRRNEGPEAWTDPKILADTLKRYPGMAVESKPRALTLTMPGRKPYPGKLCGGRSGAAGDPSPPVSIGFDGHESPAPQFTPDRENVERPTPNAQRPTTESRRPDVAAPLPPSTFALSSKCLCPTPPNKSASRPTARS